MDVIIIRRSPYVWIINEWWLIAGGGILSFLSTSFIIIVASLIYNKFNKKKTQSKILKTANPDSDSPQNPNLDIHRGGDNNIENCFTKPGVYLVVDGMLKNSIQRVVKTNGKLTIVSVSVALFAFAIKGNLVQTLVNSGLEIYFSNIKRTLLKLIFVLFITSSLSGIINCYCMALSVVIPALSGKALSVSTAVVGIIINTVLLKSLMAIDCNQFVQKLPEIVGLPYIE